MDYKIDKKNFYTMLEKVLNYNYDENFIFKEITKDVMDNVIGIKHIYYIENNNKERLFQSEYYEIFKVKKQLDYVDREYKVGDKFILSDKKGEVEKILTKDIFDYPILDILPSVLRVFLENGNSEDVNEFNDLEMSFIAMILEKYNLENENVKKRTLNLIKDNIK